MTSTFRVSTITNYSKINSDLIKYIIDDTIKTKYFHQVHISYFLPRKNNLIKKINIVFSIYL